MAKIKLRMKDIRQLSREEALAKLREAESVLMKEKAQAARGAAPSSPKIIREVKRNIARLTSFLAQREVKTER